jgi:hypothetical protein
MKPAILPNPFDDLAAPAKRKAKRRKPARKPATRRKVATRRKR